MTDDDLVERDAYPDAYWLEDGLCHECGAAVARYAIDPEHSLWFDAQGREHDPERCPDEGDESEQEDREEEE